MRVVQPSGRQRHSHKFTVYLTAEELEQLDAMTAHIRYRLGIRADRGRVVRSALALVYRDLQRGGRSSGLVRGLMDANPAQPKGNLDGEGVEWGHNKTAPGGAATPLSQGLADYQGVD